MREPKEVTILVVDDEASMRSAISFDFKRKGFQVLEAENGVQAFEMVKGRSVDVVLTDVNMPGGDGVELLKNIKMLNPLLPVVMFITGFADISLEDAYDLGVDVVFSMPFDRKALHAAVQRATTDLDKRWSSRESERLESDFEIDLSFRELNLVVQGAGLNIGRGGFFVAFSGPFPEIGATVGFSFKLEKGSVNVVEGEGIVRWVRAKTDSDRPSGCGIEFERLSELSRGQIIRFVNQLKTSAFIPKA